MNETIRYTKLAEITQLINSKLDLRESLEQVVIAISEEILQCDSVGIFLAQSDGTFRGYVSKPAAIKGMTIDQLVVDPKKDLLAKELVEKRKSIYIPDTSKDSRPDPGLITFLNIKSLLCLPIYYEDEIFGLVQLFVYNAPMELTDKEIQAVEAYVNMAAVAIRNAKLFLLQANLLEQVRNAVVYTDLNGRIIFWNRYAEILYHWKRHEVIGQNMNRILMPSRICENSQEIMDKVLELGYWEDEVTHKRKDGSELFVYSVITLVKSDDGRPVGMISVSNDITEKKTIESHMANLDRLNLVGEMAAGIGHEVRNPLTAVRGFLQLLGAKDKYAEDKEYFDLMINELDRANAIITEYLSLAKNKILDLRLQNINPIIKNIMPLLRADALIKDKFIELELEKVPDLFVDAREINQLVINLIRNGLEATAAKGSVKIKTNLECNEESCSVVLSVTDQGQGISDEILHKIGTPFVTTKEDGTGLGLAICYSIANRHNAKIDFKTDASGTTFFVRFKVPKI